MGFLKPLIGNSTGQWTFTARIAFAFLILSALAVAYYQARLFDSDTKVWAISDWLINYRAGLVRRGLIGSLVLGIADATGLDPLRVVLGLQLAIWLALLGVVLLCFASVPPVGPVLMLLISPLFLQLAYFYPGNSMMKETVAFLGLALIAASARLPRRGLLWAGSAIFALSGFANEANAFLAPAALLLIALPAARGIISRPQAITAAALVAVGSVAAMAIAVLYRGQGLYAPICAELGIYPSLARYCVEGSAIWWLDRDTAYGFDYMWGINVASGAWPIFVLGYALALVPFFFFRPAGAGRSGRPLLAAAILGILVLAPLFFVASDWGRWINMYIFALTLLAVTALRLGFIVPRTRSASPLFLLYGVVWAIPEWGAAPFRFGMIPGAVELAQRVLDKLGL